MCGPPLFQIYIFVVNKRSRIFFCCTGRPLLLICDFAVSFLVPPDGPKNGTRESAFLLFFY